MRCSVGRSVFEHSDMQPRKETTGHVDNSADAVQLHQCCHLDDATSAHAAAASLATPAVHMFRGPTTGLQCLTSPPLVPHITTIGVKTAPPPPTCLPHVRYSFHLYAASFFHATPNVVKAQHFHAWWPRAVVIVRSHSICTPHVDMSPATNVPQQRMIDTLSTCALAMHDMVPETSLPLARFQDKRHC
jgi:hypothetical protein